MRKRVLKGTRDLHNRLRRKTGLAFMMIGALVFATLALAPPRAATIEVIDLGTLPGDETSVANCNNEFGQVVGTSISATGEHHAFVWDEENGMRGLPSLAGEKSEAWGINTYGQEVVGSSETASGDLHACIWYPDGTMADMGTLPGGKTSCAYGINVHGEAVGESRTVVGENSVLHAFIWDAVNGMRDLGTLGGGYSVAWWINETGVAAGWASTGDGIGAVIWDPETGIQQLFSTPDSNSFAYDINKRGQVVGFYEGFLMYERAFVWDAEGGMHDLWLLPGGTWSVAEAITDVGQICGDADDAEGHEHAFYWDSVAGMIDLGALPDGGWSNAYSLNSKGEVVGLSDTDEAWITHATMWKVRLSPVDAIGEIQSSLQDMIENGHIKAAHASGLLAKLTTAEKQLAKGNPDAAISLLNAFIGQVEDCVDAGKISESDGDLLIDEAQYALDLIIAG